jgi:hypothetical protein
VDEINWADEPPGQPLVPVGAFDFARQVQPDYRNTVTGEVGPLSELSQRPGTSWTAFWSRPPLECTRLSDGTVFQEPSKASTSPPPRPAAPGFSRPSEALRA